MRLLVDYPKQQQSAILDLLFKPLHGASLQHLKVEVGCDGDTTQGSEPTHARSATDVDFDRGYEVSHCSVQIHAVWFCSSNIHAKMRGRVAASLTMQPIETYVASA